MELRQLRHFIAVADCGTFSAASAQLNLTQPALTRSIQTLEELVGAPLFTRAPRGVALTQEGHALLRHARLMTQQANAAVEDVVAMRDGTSGQLDIGLAPMFSTSIIDAVLVALTAAYPSLRVRVTTALLPDLIDGLLSGDFDVSLSNTISGPLPDGLRQLRLFDTHSVAVAGAKHPLALAGRASPEDLAKVRWALVKQPGSGDALTGAMNELGLESLVPTLETNSLPLLKTLLMSNQFVSVLPRHWLADALKAGDLVEIEAAGLPLIRGGGILTRTQPSRATAVDRFIAFVKDHVETASV